MSLHSVLEHGRYSSLRAFGFKRFTPAIVIDTRVDILTDVFEQFLEQRKMCDPKVKSGVKSTYSVRYMVDFILTRHHFRYH